MRDCRVFNIVKEVFLTLLHNLILLKGANIALAQYFMFRIVFFLWTQVGQNLQTEIHLSNSSTSCGRPALSIQRIVNFVLCYVWQQSNKGMCMSDIAKDLAML